MSITLNSSATNNADWKTLFQFTDGETGEVIDFTGAEIEIDVIDSYRCRKIQASTANGKITIIPGLGFELTIPASEMHGLCAGSYQIGGVYALNGETISLFTGSLSIINGIARL